MLDMIRLSANLSFLWPEIPFLERFSAAADMGFLGVEARTLGDAPWPVIAELLNAHGLQMVLMNAPVDDWDEGGRGYAAQPDQQALFKDSIERALDCADAIDIQQIHVMSGTRGDRDVLIENLSWAAELAAQARRVLTVEPINTRDMPGYFLNDLDLALEVIRAVDSPNLRLQFDLYHQQIMRGDILTSLRNAAPYISHIQIAGAPSRNEPDLGELAFERIFEAIEALGYAGWVGCEYRPSTIETRSGLRWAQPYLGD